MTEMNCLLLLGDVEESSQYLGSLISNFDSILSASKCGETLDNDGIVKNSVSITNKYYSADVQLVLHSLGASLSSSIDMFDAVIIVLSDVTKRLDDFKMLQQERVYLQLLVLLKNSDEDSRFEALLDEYSLWSVDNGYELIEISRNNIIESWNSREKVGLPRLMETLDSTMWPHVTSKTTNGKESKFKKRPESSEENIETVFSNSTMNNNINATNNDDGFRSVNSSKEEAKESKSRAESTKSTTSAYESLPDNEENPTFDNMDQFINQATKWRERVAQGGLDDNERREKASSLAIQLAQLMGIDESDEEESD